MAAANGGELVPVIGVAAMCATCHFFYDDHPEIIGRRVCRNCREPMMSDRFPYCWDCNKEHKAKLQAKNSAVSSKENADSRLRTSDEENDENDEE